MLQKGTELGNRVGLLIVEEKYRLQELSVPAIEPCRKVKHSTLSCGYILYVISFNLSQKYNISLTTSQKKKETGGGCSTYLSP